MEDPETILVPVDFREASLAALKIARDLAARLGAKVVLLHVYTSHAMAFPDTDPIASAVRTMIERLAAENGGLETILRSGDPAAEILKVIEEIKPAMVVMGTHDGKGLGHLLASSVTEKVVRSSAVPVLTVHAQPR